MSVRPSLRPTDFARRATRVATLVGACGAAGLAGCGATGANLAETDGGAKSWWSTPAALAKATTLTPPGLVADPIPSTREDLENPAALDLAYANLRTGGQSTENGRTEAEAAYQRVLKDEPRNVDALIGLARLKETAAGDRPGELLAAEQAYSAAADAAPGNARPLLALARFQATQGRWGESAASYGRAAELAKDTQESRTARHGLAVSTAMGGDIEGSRPHFVASVGEASAHFNLGELYSRAGEQDAALREFRLAAAKDAGRNPQLAQVGMKIAALEGGAPPATPARALPATNPAAPFAPQFARQPNAVRLAADAGRQPVDSYGGEAFGGDPFGGDPATNGAVFPPGRIAPGPRAVPADYAVPQSPRTSPAPRAAVRSAAPGSSASMPFAPSAAESQAPPPWPHPPAE